MRLFICKRAPQLLRATYTNFSFLGNEGEPENYELMFRVKDYLFAQVFFGIYSVKLAENVDRLTTDRCRRIRALALVTQSFSSNF